jgi:LPS-assembly lipoprotein
MHMPQALFTPVSHTLRRQLKCLLCIGLLALLSACGFRLKGETPLPFTSVYTNIAENSAFGAQLRRTIRAVSPKTHFVEDPKEAQVRLTQLSLNRGLDEVSINAQGQVEVYDVRVSLTFQLTDAQGHVLLPSTTLSASREIPYDSNALQAKQGEIGSLYTELQQSLVDGMVRRLTSPEVRAAFDNPDDLPVDNTIISPPASNNDSRGVGNDLLRMPNLNPTGAFY